MAATEKTEEPAGDEPTKGRQRIRRRAGKDEDRGSRGTPTRTGGGVKAVRTQLARVVWAVCVVLASVLALGALCIALDANRDNGLVDLLLRVADQVDLGVFSRTNGVKQFGGGNAEVKNALFNWGLGAVVWLVVGRIADRVIRP